MPLSLLSFRPLLTPHPPTVPRWPGGGWIVDMLITPTANFMLRIHPMNVHGGNKAIIVEKDTNVVDARRCSTCNILRWWRLDFAPQLDLSVPSTSMWRLFSPIYRLYHLAIYGEIRNCLVMKRNGWQLVYLVHVEHRGETGWRPRRPQSEMYN